MTKRSELPLEKIMASRNGSVDPSIYPNEIFDLYSIPAFDTGEPEVVAGCDIGSTKQIVEPGDVLLSKIVPHIRRAWVVGANRGRRIIASSEWIVFRSDWVEPRWLRHLLTSDSFHAQFLATVSGVGGSLLRARPAHVAKITIPIPALPEQRRIADILDKADAIRRKRQELTNLAGGLLPSAFVELFGDPATNPREWQVEPLGKYLTFLTSGSRGWAEHYVARGKRFIRSLDVQINEIADIDPCFVEPPSGTEADRTRVKDGDVLLTITGSRIGRVAYVPNGFGEAYVSQHVAILRLQPPLRPRFVSMFLSLPAGGQCQIQRDQYGQTKPGLSLEQIRKFKIPVVPTKIQDRFVEVWDKHEALFARLKKANTDIDTLFHSLVQRAFRGEL